MWFQANSNSHATQRCNRSWELDRPNDIQSGKPSPPPSDFCLFVLATQPRSHEPNKMETTAMCVGKSSRAWGNDTPPDALKNPRAKPQISYAPKDVTVVVCAQACRGLGVRAPASCLPLFSLWFWLSSLGAEQDEPHNLRLEKWVSLLILLWPFCDAVSRQLDLETQPTACHRAKT